MQKDIESLVAVLKDLTPEEFNRVWGFALGAKAARAEQQE